MFDEIIAKEQLEQLTCDELRVICRNEKIQYYRHSCRYKKAEMIEEIVRKRKMENTTGKKNYIDNLTEGMLIAFKFGENKAKSAKVIRKSTRDRKVEVETEYGAKFIVSFDDILWVRTGVRWPRGIYEMLKAN